MNKKEKKITQNTDIQSTVVQLNVQKDKATMKKCKNLDWSTFYFKKSYFYS